MARAARCAVLLSSVLLAAVLGEGAAAAEGWVTLRGRVEWAGSGPIRVEALIQDEDGQLIELSAVTLAGPGPFELQVPASSGAVRLRAGSDPEGDGIGPQAAMGLYPGVVQVGGQDVTSLKLVLSHPAGRSR